MCARFKYLAGKQFLTLFGLLCCVNLTTSIAQSAKPKAIKPDYKLIGGFDSRNSFIQQSPVTIYGLSLGFSIDEKEQFELGFYTLTPQSARFIMELNSSQNERITDAGLYFAGIGYTRRLLTYKWLELNLPLEAGIGATRLRKTVLRGGQEIELSNDHGFIPLQAGLQIDIGLHRWFGIGGSAGYRTTLINADYETNYNGPYFTYGLSFYLGTIYRDMIRYEKYHGSEHGY